MKHNCNCYETIERLRYSPFYTHAYYEAVGICNGTRERDECSCGGDRAKCDFYPEVRAKVIQEQEESKIDIGENSLIVTYDFCSPDTPTLCVARKKDDNIKVLNTIQGDVAYSMYHCLTGSADLIRKHGHWFLLDECSNAGVYCSACHKKVYKEHYANVKEKSKFCPNCGAIMDEKFIVL